MRIPITKLLLTVGALSWLSGCASIGPPEAPSLELPKPPTDLRAVRKGDKVTLTWTIPARTTERQSVKYLGKTNVCRSLGGTIKECDKGVADVEAPADFEARKTSGKKLAATFTDTLAPAMERENPDGFATYGVEVLNTAERGAGISNQVRVALVPTMAAFGGFVARAVDQGVMISWECPAVRGSGGNGIQYSFRIYRRAEASANETKIGEVEDTECAVGSADAKEHAAMEHGKVVTSFLDQTFEWEKTYFYRGTVVSEIEAAGRPTVEVEGDDTAEVKVFAHDVFPPAVPAGLQAVFSGPGQAAFIDLIWAPVGDADLAGYNVYRHEAGAAVVKVNAELVKAPAFRDAQVATGKKYFYSVRAVDERGNESGRSEEAGESVP